jgi:HK97 family phage prohead protease
VTYPFIERSVPLLDIEINRNGDGRTVTAYAATWTPYPVVDADGDYDEQIEPTGFNRELGRGFGHVSVVYNHGLTLWGTPSERHSTPIGVPLDIKADSRGLLTVTRYAKTDAASEVLELIREGAITAQSFRGPVYKASAPRRQPTGRLLIVRQELGLREYGPTPMPANDRASIVAVRSSALAEQIAALTDEQRDALARLIQPTPRDTPQDDAQEPTEATPPVPGTDPGQEAPPQDDHDLELAEIAAALRRRRTP